MRFFIFGGERPLGKSLGLCRMVVLLLEVNRRLVFSGFDERAGHSLTGFC